MVAAIIGGTKNDNPFQVRRYRARRRLNNNTEARITSSFRLCSLMKLLVLLIAALSVQQTLRFAGGHGASTGPNQIATSPSVQLELEKPLRAKYPAFKKIFKAKTAVQRESTQRSRQEFQHVQDKLRPCHLEGDCLPLSPSSDPIFVRNVIPQNRFLCGQLIPGNGIFVFRRFPKACSRNTRSHVFSPGPPTLSGGNEMPPIDLFWNVNSLRLDKDDELETVSFPCSIPCRTNRKAVGIVSTVSVKDTPWEILSTMEGEAYFSQAKIKPDAYQNDQFYATTSFKSEIPMPYFSWSEYKINNPPVDFDTSIKGALFLANNCNSISDRESLIEELLQTSLRIDALSGCFHNSQPPPGVDLSNSTQVQQQYLFYLAFENQKTEDYVTEKLWGSLRAGTLPVYFGAPNIRDHVPPKSVIFVDDFHTSRDLADYLILLTKDKSLYESYHTWRYADLDESFMKKYDFTKVHSTCRMCKFSYAMKHGFRFDYRSQEVQQPRFPRKTCRNKLGLVGYPFKEYWLSGTGASTSAVHVESRENTKTCMLNNDNRVLTIARGAAYRFVYDQDGVTDFVINGMGNRTDLELRIETEISSDSLVHINTQEHWLQDASTRLTILASKEVRVSVRKKGMVQLPVQPPIRIRVIVEDVDHFHKGAWKYHSYFGEVMVQDFFFPLEAYKIVGS
eukprot:scaffold1778_cov101-Cylindrotheca_fusiformis.AAC.4